MCIKRKRLKTKTITININLEDPKIPEPELIDIFCDKVENMNYVLNVYKEDKNGKNKWNCICSAMDWLRVAIDYIENPPPYSDNDNIRSMQVYTYISSIDIVWQAITQLHRVFFNTNKEPFVGSKHIFQHNSTNMDDSSYFKTIRACFGAHPVNLDDKFLNDEQEKRFASWSTDMVGDGDYSVFLYSNKVGENDIPFDIYFSELREFFEERYYYLKKIIEEIDKQYSDYIDKMQKQIIPRDINILKQIGILKHENNLRLKIEWFDYLLQKLELIYGISVTKEENKLVIEKYRDAAKIVVEEIYQKLQTMDESNTKTHNIIDVQCPHEYKYAFSCLCENMNGKNKPLLLSGLFKYLSDFVVFDGVNQMAEIYVLVLAGLYYAKDKSESNPC